MALSCRPIHAFDDDFLSSVLFFYEWLGTCWNLRTGFRVLFSRSADRTRYLLAKKKSERRELELCLYLSGMSKMMMIFKADVELINTRANDTCATRCDQRQSQRCVEWKYFGGIPKILLLSASRASHIYVLCARPDRSSATTQGGHVSKESHSRPSHEKNSEKKKNCLSIQLIKISFEISCWTL